MTLTNGDFLGWVAISSKPLRGIPFLVVLEQDTHLKRPVISVDAVSPPSSALEQGSDAARETRPICTSISAFFLKGLGARPSGSVALWTYDDHRVVHSIEIDPSTATLTLQPILRVPSPDHPKRTDRANLDFYFNVDVASSTERPFLVFALSRARSGDWHTLTMLSSEHHYGGNRLPDDGEMVFYALDVGWNAQPNCRGAQGS